MRYSVKAAGVALLLAVVAISAPFAPAAQDGRSLLDKEAPPETKKLTAALIEEIVQASHAPRIYADARKTLRDVYLPIMRDTVQGDLAGVAAPDAKAAASMAKVMTFLDYLRRAADELDQTLTEDHDTIVSDAAGIVARHAAPSEIEDLRRLLHLPAIQKAFDAFYKTTQVVTGLSYEDSRSFAEFSGFVRGLKLDYASGFSGLPGSPQSPPPQARVAKAQAMLDDLLKISRFDEIVNEVKRFARDVYADTAPISPQQRQEFLEQVDQLEFAYGLQRSVALAVTPPLIAAALTDEQINTVHSFIRSPACARAFDLIYKSVRAATSPTKDEVLEAQALVKEIDRKSGLHDKNSEQAAEVEAEWNAFAEKWGDIIKKKMSPETRRGLEQSFEALQAVESPI